MAEYTSEGKLNEHLEYFRHRERIARGVVFNSLGLTVSLAVLRASGHTEFVTRGIAIPTYQLCIGCLFLGLIGWLAWAFVNQTFEHRRRFVEHVLGPAKMARGKVADPPEEAA